MEQVEIVGDGGGNTEITPVKRETQHKYWCFTYNNPEGAVERLEQILKTEVTWYVFQEETGDSGTPHYQGTLCLQQRQRRSQLSKLEPAIHWEPTRSVKASIAYCSKEESRTGAIFSYGIDLPEVREQITCVEPRGWQLDVLALLDQPPQPRTIHWFWEPTGGVGKSELTKWLVVKKACQVVSGKSADIFHALSKVKPSKIQTVIVDIPRVAQDFVNYGAIEAVKNGLLFSGKYDSTTVVFNVPRVICFANTEPDRSKMSADRWDIRLITVFE